MLERLIKAQKLPEDGAIRKFQTKRGQNPSDTKNWN